MYNNKFQVVKINPIDFETIKCIVEKADEVTLYVNTSPGFNNLMLSSIEDVTSLYFKVNYKELIISNVNLKNKKIGTMTSVLNEIIAIAKKYNLQRILVESVLTQEMYNFCIKNGFKKEKSIYEFTEVSKIFGNYYLDL